MTVQQKDSYGRSNVTSLDEVRQAKAKALEEQVAADAAVSEGLSEETRDHGNRRFDAEKVSRIKAAIAAGEYKIDPSRIADRFIEHDRNQ